MKLLKISLVLIIYILASQNTVMELRAQNANMNLMTEFSLFYEAHKNKQFDEWTLGKGFNVINTDPTPFVKYNPFTKMEEIIFFLHDSVSTTDELQKEALADTALYLYDVAAKYDEKKAGYYLAKKAYVLETWENAEQQVVIDAYEKALETDPNLQSQYKDRYADYLVKHSEENPDLRIRAIDIYSKLADEEPDNPLWPSRLANIVTDIDEMMDIHKKVWDNDKDNVEKAWTYATTCFKAQNWERAVEPLKYLTEISPDVINYWRQLGSAYDKLGENDKAINAYKKVIELQPDSRDNYVNLALVYKKIDQLSVARTYLRKASNEDPNWDYPYYIEGSLYEQAVRTCMGAKFEFDDKLVFQLAVDAYRVAKNKGGQFASIANERIQALSNSTPQKEDYFFRKLQSGETVKVEGSCYGWIQKTVTVP